jgi:hypothetical protein
MRSLRTESQAPSCGWLDFCPWGKTVGNRKFEAVLAEKTLLRLAVTIPATEVFTEKQRNTPSLQGLSRIVMRSSAYTPPT